MSYVALKLDGNGYASIADGDQVGLNMGYSDFMIEVRFKHAGTGANEYIWYDWVSETGILLRSEDGKIRLYIGDGVNTPSVISSTTYNDSLWHYLAIPVDRSSATGMKFYIDGSEVSYTSQEDPTSVGDMNSGATKYLTSSVGSRWAGELDEARIWNFGYGGLPADYAAYITWRAAGRNVFKDISEYNSGAWNGYADADRTEKVTDPGLENWTNNTPDDWTEGAESAGVRDIIKELVEIHGGSAAVKLEATNNVGGTNFYVYQNTSPIANKYYCLGGWIYFSTRTSGVVRMYVSGVAVSMTALTSTNGSYTYYEKVFDIASSNAIHLRLEEETTTGIVYFDDISIRRVGLVAYWKLNGDYTDETSNANDLTAGGTGNTFLGYTLKRHKIISPYSVW